MAQVDIPTTKTSRRRTRPYDDPTGNLGQKIEALHALMPPAGVLVPTLADKEPAGDAWKLCNGQSLPKAEYPRLYEVFGGKYGETDLDFRLPNMEGRTVIGLTPELLLGAATGHSAITLSIDQIPSHGHAVVDSGHSHEIQDPGHTHPIRSSNQSANLSSGGIEAVGWADRQSGTSKTGVSVQSASTGISVSPTGGGNPVDITPPSIVVNWMVRT